MVHTMIGAPICIARYANFRYSSNIAFSVHARLMDSCLPLFTLVCETTLYPKRGATATFDIACEKRRLST